MKKQTKKQTKKAAMKSTEEETLRIIAAAVVRLGKDIGVAIDPKVAAFAAGRKGGAR